MICIRVIRWWARSPNFLENLSGTLSDHAHQFVQDTVNESFIDCRTPKIVTAGSPQRRLVWRSHLPLELLPAGKRQEATRIARAEARPRCPY